MDDKSSSPLRATVTELTTQLILQQPIIRAESGWHWMLQKGYKGRYHAFFSLLWLEARRTEQR
jgi:hypothetical protein